MLHEPAILHPKVEKVTLSCCFISFQKGFNALGLGTFFWDSLVLDSRGVNLLRWSTKFTSADAEYRYPISDEDASLRKRSQDL